MTDFINKIIEDFGENALIDQESNIDVIPTGSLSLDVSIGIGGIPRGKITEVFGPEGCLSGDTFIQYKVVTKDGKIQNSKGGSLKRLYERFNKLQSDILGTYQRKVSENSLFYVSAIKDDGTVFSNLVADVIYSGKRKTYIVTIESGETLICTSEHKFFTSNNEYRSLDDGLSVGDIVFVHHNIPYTVENKGAKKRYKEVSVKYHPSERLSIINGCTYFRVRVSHLVYEAEKNNMTVEDYRWLLNSCISGGKSFPENMWTVPADMDIHHKDENPENNSIENLELIEKKEHYRSHARKNIRNFSFIVTESKIKSIIEHQEIDTYDIKCYSPYNNYIANKIVVHNSAKTTLALSIVKEALKLNLKALYVDAEHMLDYSLLKDMIGEEINSENLVILNPATAEDAFTMLESGINSGEFGLVVLDSVGALAPKKEQEDDFADANVGLVARMVSKFLRRNIHAIKENNVALFIINQVRDKIGAYMATFETPGGHALKHFSSLRIQLSRGTVIEQGKEQVGILAKFVIKKNKMSAPFRSFFMPVLFGKGIDSYTDAVDFCSMLGIIKKSGAFYKFDGETLGQGKLAAAETLRKNPATLDKMKVLVYNSLNKNTAIDIESLEESEEEVE